MCLRSHGNLLILQISIDSIRYSKNCSSNTCRVVDTGEDLFLEQKKNFFLLKIGLDEREWVGSVLFSVTQFFLLGFSWSPDNITTSSDLKKKKNIQKVIWASEIAILLHVKHCNSTILSTWLVKHVYLCVKVSTKIG